MDRIEQEIGFLNRNICYYERKLAFLLKHRNTIEAMRFEGYDYSGLDCIWHTPTVNFVSRDYEINEPDDNQVIIDWAYEHDIPILQEVTNEGTAIKTKPIQLNGFDEEVVIRFLISKAIPAEYVMRTETFEYKIISCAGGKK